MIAICDADEANLHRWQGNSRRDGDAARARSHRDRCRRRAECGAPSLSEDIRYRPFHAVTCRYMPLHHLQVLQLSRAAYKLILMHQVGGAAASADGAAALPRRVEVVQRPAGGAMAVM